MRVRKRNLREQKFDADKIKLTLEKASDEAKEPLCYSEINRMADEIEKYINVNFKDVIDVDELVILLIDTLRKNGFNEIADYYKNKKL